RAVVSVRCEPARRGGRRDARSVAFRAPRARAGLAAAALSAVLSLASPPAVGDTEGAGDVLRLALPAAALAVTVRQDDAEGREHVCRAVAATDGATELLSAVGHGLRRDGTQGEAFPSGHAAMACQAAGVLHRRYGAGQ